MGEIPIDRKFAVLSEITRAQHFAWHEAVLQACPGADIRKIVDTMWEVTGHQTAKAYLPRLDPARPLPAQVAASIVWSSQCMGEAATLETAGDEARVRHADCPWFHWHRRLGLLAEDRPGCDVWFQTIVADVNEALGTRLRVETLESLPDGGSSCLRRFWTDR